MLPTPLISDWSSRARLTPVCRWRSRRARAAGSKDGSNGSGAMWAIGPGSSAPSGTKHMWPNVRWSVKRRSGPESLKVNRIRTCGDRGRSGSPTSSWPLMPRCASRASSPTDSHRYLPRRLTVSRLRPVSAASKSAAPARWRRTERGCRTRTVSMARPEMWCSRPRRTVSTSGSSGTRSAVSCGTGCLPVVSVVALVVLRPGGLRVDRVPGRLGRVLLGRLLGVALAGAEHAPADPDRGPERLLVVRPALLDLVVRHPEHAGRGQLLERGLPVQSGTQPGRPGDDRVEQAMDQRAGLGQPAVDVDRPDDGLQRVGQDRGLVAAAGHLFAPAEPDVGAQAQLPRHIGQGLHLDHGRAQLG